MQLFPALGTTPVLYFDFVITPSNKKDIRSRFSLLSLVEDTTKPGPGQLDLRPGHSDTQVSKAQHFECLVKA